MPPKRRCESCRLVPADLEYRDGSVVCVLCAELLGKLGTLGIDVERVPRPLRLPSEAVALMGGLRSLRKVKVAPLLYEPPSRHNRGDGVLAAVAVNPAWGPAQASITRTPAPERLVQLVHPAVLREVFARFGPLVRAPMTPTVRVAGGFLDPVLVAKFDRRTILDYALMPCRIAGDALVAATTGPWPPVERDWPERFAALIKKSVISLAGAHSLQLRTVVASEFTRALEAAPWGAPMTFPDRQS